MATNYNNTNELGLRELAAAELQAIEGGTEAEFEVLKAVMQSLASLYASLSNVLNQMDDTSKGTIRQIRA
jgi:hypothetical protein